MFLPISRATARGARVIVRFAVLLLVLSLLYDLSGPMSLCFDPSRPFMPESLPLCFLFSFGLLIEGLGSNGLPGFLWHYLPTITVSFLVAIAWTLKDRRRAQT
jgi:hypothetical protein